jgi:hypothetical protein
MPRLPDRKPPRATWPQQLYSSCGRGRRDFYVLGRNTDYDEAFDSANPETYISPTSYYTQVIHYVDYRREAAYRVPDRLLDMWWSSTRRIAYTAGFPRAVFEVDEKEIRELVLDAHNGAFIGLWGVGEEHVFACGVRPFVLYRRFGAWQEISLPPLRTEHLHDIYGSAENDVYVVGGGGTILYFDGQRIAVLETPTTRNLLSIAPLGGGYYCAGGAGGILLVGNRRGWRLVPSPVEEDLLSLAQFDGKVFFGTEQGLYMFDGRSGPTRVLDMPLDGAEPLGDGVLVTHETEAWVYDGSELTPLDTTI